MASPGTTDVTVISEALPNAAATVLAATPPAPALLAKAADALGSLAPAVIALCALGALAALAAACLLGRRQSARTRRRGRGSLL